MRLRFKIELHRECLGFQLNWDFWGPVNAPGSRIYILLVDHKFPRTKMSPRSTLSRLFQVFSASPFRSSTQTSFDRAGAVLLQTSWPHKVVPVVLVCTVHTLPFLCSTSLSLKSLTSSPSRPDENIPPTTGAVGCSQTLWAMPTANFKPGGRQITRHLQPAADRYRDKRRQDFTR